MYYEYYLYNKPPFAERLLERHVNVSDKDMRNIENYWISRLKDALNLNRRNVTTNDRSNGVTTLSYRPVRAPGYWRPVFMFIERGSTEDLNLILRELINTGMSYLIIGKNGLVHHNIYDNQYRID